MDYSPVDEAAPSLGEVAGAGLGDGKCAWADLVVNLPTLASSSSSCCTRPGCPGLLSWAACPVSVAADGTPSGGGRASFDATADGAERAAVVAVGAEVGVKVLCDPGKSAASGESESRASLEGPAGDRVAAVTFHMCTQSRREPSLETLFSGLRQSHALGSVQTRSRGARPRRRRARTEDSA